MELNSRISSILNANHLDSSITGLQDFSLSDLVIENQVEFKLPTNLRLGHLAEKIVSELIKSSTNYRVLYENIQVIQDKQTVGEIDFIIEEVHKKMAIHLELAYKFYLFDPNISSSPIKNWIGPNRNDSLVKKLDKLKRKQFPLLYHDSTKSLFPDIELDKVSQMLCLLVSLYIPYNFKGKLNPIYQKAIKGYYLNLDTFTSLNKEGKMYCLPSRKKWGIEPSENEEWIGFKEIENHVIASMEAKQTPLCWQKYKGEYSAFFISWW